MQMNRKWIGLLLVLGASFAASSEPAGAQSGLRRPPPFARCILTSGHGPDRRGLAAYILTGGPNLADESYSQYQGHPPDSCCLESPANCRWYASLAACNAALPTVMCAGGQQPPHRYE